MPSPPPPETDAEPEPHVSDNEIDDSDEEEVCDELVKSYLADINATFGEKNQTALHIAVKDDNVDVVEVLLRNGANIEARDDDGRTPLLEAGYADNLAMIKLLVESGADIEAKTNKSEARPLYLAAFKGNLDGVKYLLDRGASVDEFTAYGRNPLSAAAIKGNLAMVKELVERGAKPSNPKSVALMLAAFYDRVEVVEYLLDHGADIEGVDKNGATAIHYASEGNSLTAVRVLIRRGANVNVQCKRKSLALNRAIEQNHMDIFKELIRNGANFNVEIHPPGYPPLLCAATRGHPSFTQELLKLGAWTEFPFKDVKQPLLAAAKEKYTETVKLLLAHGASMSVTNDGGCTPLHYAALSKKLDMVQEVLIYGGDPDAQNDRGQVPQNWTSDKTMIEMLNDAREAKKIETPLHQAIRDNSTAAVEELLQSVDPNETIERPLKSPLLFAVTENNVEMAKLLLERGALPNLSIYGSQTPLLWALTYRYVEMAKLLLKHGAAADCIQEYSGRTALHLAVEVKDVELIKMLVSRGVDVMAKSKDNLRASEVASDNEVKKALIEAEDGVEITEAYRRTGNQLIRSTIQDMYNEVQPVMGLDDEGCNTFTDELMGDELKMYLVLKHANFVEPLENMALEERERAVEAFRSGLAAVCWPHLELARKMMASNPDFLHIALGDLPSSDKY